MTFLIKGKKRGERRENILISKEVKTLLSFLKIEKEKNCYNIPNDILKI
jgi:hypothetical protein